MELSRKGVVECIPVKGEFLAAIDILCEDMCFRSV